MTLLGAGVGSIAPVVSWVSTTDPTFPSSSLTYSGPSLSTMFDSTGKLIYKPNNQFTFSDDMTNGAWWLTTATMSLASGVNTLTATSTTASVSRTGTLTVATGNVIYSIKAKGGTGLFVALRAFSFVTSGTDGAWFNLTNGTVATVQSGVTAGISGPDANGFYTCWIKFTPTVATTGFPYLYVTDADASYGVAIGKTLLLKNAQFEVVTYEAAPRAYNPTTASAFYGARVEWDPNTLAVKGLLIEEARTNYAFRAFNLSDAGWATTGGSKASATDLSGGSTATTFTPSGAGTHYIRYAAAGTLTNTVVYTMTAYVKFGGAAFVWIGDGGGSAWVWGSVNTSTLAVATNGTVSSSMATPVAMGGGVYKLQLTWTRDIDGAAIPIVFPYTATASGYGNVGYPSWSPAGTESITVLGVQTEAGVSGTSPIPTATASVTRAADVVQFTGPALTALQGTDGTFIVESISESGSSPAAITNIVRGTNSIIYHDTTGKTGTTNGTTALLTAAAPTWNASLRNGLAWSASGRSLAYTGGAVATDANTVSNGGTLYLGSNNGSAVENGWYKSFGIWNQRLGDATLQTKLTVGGSYAANDNGIRYAFADNDNLPIHWRVAL